MSHRRSRLPWCALLALCIVCVTAQAQAPAYVTAAVKKLTEDVAAGKKINVAEAKAFAKKWDDLDDVMRAAFKQQKNANLEVILNKLAKKKSFTAADKAVLTKIADLSRAMAIVTPHYPPQGRPPVVPAKRDWDRWSKDMGAASAALLQAIKAGGAPTIAKEAMKLAGSCCDCHR